MINTNHEESTIEVRIHFYTDIDPAEVPEYVYNIITDKILVSNWMKAEIIRNNKKINAYAAYMLDLDEPSRANLIVIAKNGKIAILLDDCHMMIENDKEIVRCWVEL